MRKPAIVDYFAGSVERLTSPGLSICSALIDVSLCGVNQMMVLKSFIQCYIKFKKILCDIVRFASLHDHWF